MSQMRENLKPGVEGEEAHVLSPAHVQHRNLQPLNHHVEIPEPEIPRQEPETPEDHRSDSENRNNELNPDGEVYEDDNEVYTENQNPNQANVSVDGGFEAQKQRAQAQHRKRKKSNSTADGNYVPPYKKNRHFRRQSSVLPSKFLLGGNIRDPLNLASLADEQVNAMLNKETPTSSPMPVPPHRQGEIPVFIPKNPDDPLGLQSGTPKTPECNGMEPFSPPPRPETPPFQRRMLQHAIANPPRKLSEQVPPPQRPQTLNKNLCRKRFRHKSDPIVSPVIPQPGCRRRLHHYHQKRVNSNSGVASCQNSNSVQNASSSSSKIGDQVDGNRKFREKDQIFQFGNYKRYYGYRNTPDGEDPRLRVFKREWFDGKDVLDVGCNIGHVTLSIARDLGTRRVHGIDIDNYLITVARKNIKHYMVQDPQDKDVVFPQSLPMIYGAIQPPPRNGQTTPTMFPYNVTFCHENYVFSNDALLETVKPEYDVILLLSLTKWIHLNFGDDGIKRLFYRSFRHLRPGGKLILEPQEWSSYKRKKKLTEKIFATYQSIRFFPDRFQDFLLKTVGYASVESLGPPTHHSKGFQRHLLVFTKPLGSSPSSLISSNN